MLRLIIILSLVFGIPISTNAAGIYDNSLLNSDNKKKEKLESIYIDAIHSLNKNIDEAASEYEVELLSIQKKNKIKYSLQDKSLNYQKFYLADTGSNNLIKVIYNDDSYPLSLLKENAGWEEIKASLNYTNMFFNAVDSLINKNIDEYFGGNRNANLVLITNIQTIRSSSGKPNSYEKNKLFNVGYQGEGRVKGEEYAHITTSTYNDALNSKYGRDEENIFSIIYLWKMYSDAIVIILLIITTLWLVIASLIKFLTQYI